MGERFDVGTDVAARYRITRFLGAGGMGEVYAARDSVLDAEVALKTIKPELEQSSVALERFRREIAFARRVTDPHVCRLHDVGEHAGRVFLTMELLDGKPLAPPLSIAELDRIAPQLVRGLGALHRAGIVHRDFKTANLIMVGDRAVVTDFGLARSVDQDAALTIDSGLLGTPAYMAPEQVEGRAATPASDVYALGVVLFELATGQRPFDEATAMATATARLTRDPPKPSSLRRDLPARWDAIITRCLARDPAARPALDDVLATHGSTRRVILAAGGLGLVAAGFGAWRMLGGEAKTVEAPRPLVAVLAVDPVKGMGPQTNPLRCALSVDVHDRMTRTAIELLWLTGGGMWENVRGTAQVLAKEPDPTAAAFALDGVSAVVRTKLLEYGDPIRVELTITKRGGSPNVIELRRPSAEATTLVDEIARAIARVLDVPAPPPSKDAGRYAPDVYVRYGEALLAHFTREQHTTPLRALSESEPKLQRAAVRYACGLVEDGEQLENTEVLAKMDEAIAILDKTLAIDPEHALARAVRGRALMVKWDWKGADAETKQAYVLAPAHARVTFQRGQFTMCSGRFDEHIAIARKKLRTNPLTPNHPLHGLAFSLYNCRRYDECIATYQQLARLTRASIDDPTAASAFAELGRYDEAIAAADLAWAQFPAGGDPYYMTPLVSVYMLSGQPEKARKLRAQLGDLTDLWVVALMDDALGNLDAALANAEKVVAAHNLHATFIGIVKFSNAMRAHPRFQALVKKVGIS